MTPNPHREAGHTPGPWSISSLLPFLIIEDLGNDMVRNIASVNRRKGGRSRDDAEAIANAHLIAAAPTLYLALENILSWTDEDATAAAAREALAKARGESA